MEMRLDIHRFPLRRPFVITDKVFETSDTVRVTLEQDGVIGRGEAVGSYYLGESPESMRDQLLAVEGDISSGISSAEVADLMPACGARNALDCALWDLFSKRQNQRVWNLLDLPMRPVTTVYTLSIDAPEAMAAHAQDAAAFKYLKVKLDRDRPVEKIEAIRRVRPEADIIVDVNQGWSFAELKDYAPLLAAQGVSLLEQPLPRGADEMLAGYKSPLPIACDESCLHLGEFWIAAERYDVLNIKLDKCGGLSEALTLARQALSANLQVMVGNMAGSSLSMAPSYVLAQLCRFVDIDGPLLLAEDVADGMDFGPDGSVSAPVRALWG